MLMLAIGGMSLRHRILMTLGSIVCSLSMIPIGIILLSKGSEAMDYVCGGMALVAGIPLLLLGVLGTIGTILIDRARSSAVNTKP